MPENSTWPEHMPILWDHFRLEFPPPLPMYYYRQKRRFLVTLWHPIRSKCTEPPPLYEVLLPLRKCGAAAAAAAVRVGTLLVLIVFFKSVIFIPFPALYGDRLTLASLTLKSVRKRTNLFILLLKQNSLPILVIGCWRAAAPYKKYDNIHFEEQRHLVKYGTRLTTIRIPRISKRHHFGPLIVCAL